MALITEEVKYLPQHMHEAYEGITKDVVAQAIQPWLKELQIMRKRFSIINDHLDSEARELLVDRIRGGIYGNASFEAGEAYNFITAGLELVGGNRTVCYNYRTGEYGYEMVETSLILGRDDLSLVAADVDYILGEGDEKAVLKQHYQIWKKRGKLAIENMSLRGEVNWIYNQYLKSDLLGPFTQGRLTFDLFTDQDVSLMLKGFARGTEYARNAVRYAVKDGVNVPGNWDFMREMGLYDSLKWEYEHNAESSGLRNNDNIVKRFFKDVIREYQETGIVNVTPEGARTYITSWWTLADTAGGFSNAYRSDEERIDFLKKLIAIAGMEEEIAFAKANRRSLHKNSYYHPVYGILEKSSHIPAVNELIEMDRVLRIENELTTPVEIEGVVHDVPVTQIRDLSFVTIDRLGRMSNADRVVTDEAILLVNSIALSESGQVLEFDLPNLFMGAHRLASSIKNIEVPIKTFWVNKITLDYLESMIRPEIADILEPETLEILQDFMAKVKVAKGERSLLILYRSGENGYILDDYSPDTTGGAVLWEHN